MNPLNTFAEFSGIESRFIAKVVSAKEFIKGLYEPENCVYWADHPDSQIREDFLKLNWKAVLATDTSRFDNQDLPIISKIKDAGAVDIGDVINVSPESKRIRVLFRRGSNSNFIFITNRCNSQCLMCSQPPTPADDSWLVQEALDYIPLMDKDEKWIGITGGEPTLAGNGLVSILKTCKEELPNSGVHILSNGRLFGSTDMAKLVSAVGHEKLAWAIPLYSEQPETHDYVVQAKDAFRDTVRGLYRLGEYRQKVEIRIVLHKLTVPRLRELANFIYRNFSFAAHIAFMGIEPIGFAKKNRDQLWIDPVDYMNTLEEAVYFLHNRGMAASIYNLPMCTLKPSLFPFARKSISDWKNKFIDECSGCLAKDRCTGFFGSHELKWKSRGIVPFTESSVFNAN